jgi:hypothetical protein
VVATRDIQVGEELFLEYAGNALDTAGLVTNKLAYNVSLTNVLRTIHLTKCMSTLQVSSVSKECSKKTRRDTQDNLI